MNADQPTMLVAMAALTQSLEDVLCEYRRDMTGVTSAVTCKLLHHAAQHIEFMEVPDVDAEFTGLIH